jgi:hypothetical protein
MILFCVLSMVLSDGELGGNALMVDFEEGLSTKNWDASKPVLGRFGKLLRRRGASAWFHGVWMCGVEVLEY